MQEYKDPSTLQPVAIVHPLMAQEYSAVAVSSPVHPFLFSGCLGRLYLSAIVNNAFVNIGAQMSVGPHLAILLGAHSEVDLLGPVVALCFRLDELPRCLL